ncbi:TetR/AcrR family transcriptional regulator [Chlorogloeopsis fritschii PCC 9212]|uniref:TetR family transcriptional regulator n=1 Tax=Chlorogloeopsis fritschii PCC 6912 TaxID=211165 RepID=A0A3S0Y9E3_CHLFR|nr:TetR/AcrR family transcriptional regulator [Chlorogloeopsis fritschii]RUR87005.1 TetR family transcriptional regulator [Chlorogloeopsis fritschii PCC 6912]
MNADTNRQERSPRSTRTYNSQLRKKQASQTRQLILKALAEQLATKGIQDFAIADAAQRAGVSPRTIYRYFPNRDALLEALGLWIDEQLGDPPYPNSVDDIVEMVEKVFPKFDEQATLVQALLLSELGKSVRSRLRIKRRESVAQSLQPVVEHLDATEAKAVRAVIQHLASADMWNTMRDEYGLEGKESAQAVAWAIRTLIAELQHQKNQTSTQV